MNMGVYLNTSETTILCSFVGETIWDAYHLCDIIFATSLVSWSLVMWFGIKPKQHLTVMDHDPCSGLVCEHPPSRPELRSPGLVKACSMLSPLYSCQVNWLVRCKRFS